MYAKYRFVALVASAALVLGGCGGAPQLMPTPNVYANRGAESLFADVPPALQSNHVEVLYLTDRGLKKGSTPEYPLYGHTRSRSVGFGVCDVRFGQDVTWNQLVRASTATKRDVKLGVALTKTTEICRFPPTPKTLIELSRPSTQPSTASLEADAALKTCLQELSARLAHSDVKDVYLYVHGVKNDFGGSVNTIAQLWHFLGRKGVAVAYSWPSGGKGLLRGYNYDYNSSEFTVYHLKQAIRAIASCPDVHKLHVIAHSRGTDAVVSAIRELHLEISGGKRSTRDELKLGTVILAAPDLDVDVVIQRVATARLGMVPERAVIYICDKDSALGLSRFLFGSMRLGKLKPEIFTPEELEALRDSKNLAIIDARVEKPGSFGHNYFYQNPAVSSDLILVMRYHLAPGVENGRPLNATKTGFWSIDDRYGKKLAIPGRISDPTTRPSTAR